MKTKKKKKKKEKNKVTFERTETIEEFLAKGGEITIVPPEEEEETKTIVRAISGGLPTIMTLSDGAHFFGETRKKKKKIVTKDECADKISNSSLPIDIIASLKKTIGIKSE